MNPPSALHAQLIDDLESTRGNAALCVLSLDNLGRIAGEHGIRASENATQEFEYRISAIMRHSDRKLTLAPDRVCVVFDELRDPNHTLLVALKIERCFDAPMLLDDAPIKLTPRAGLVYCGSTDDREDANELYQHAETARVLAAEQDTCFQIASRSNVARARNDWNIEALVREALTTHQLELFYQPLVRLKDEHLVGLEALIRWHRNGEIVTPNEFLPMLSGSTLRELAGYCVRSAMRDIASFPAAPPIAINLDPGSVRDGEFLDLVTREAAIWHIPASQLRFEITETDVIENYLDTTATLRKFRESGFGISIDDFGSGYSSLQHFGSLPADEIKIDRSFIHDLARDESKQHITQTIIDLAHRFSRTVVAEGIEDRATADLLREQGCDNGQGYLFGRPANLDATRSLIEGDA